MRAYLPDYELRQASDLQDALARLAAGRGEWRPLAGGTDLMVLLESGVLPRGQYLSVWGLPELHGIDVTDAEISLGALTTYAEVRRSAALGREFPLLGLAAAETGGLAIQNRGTLGGNIANASPAADTPPVLLVYDAQLEVVSARGRRRVRYDTFHRDYKVMDLAPDELIARIILPRGRTGWQEYYRKVGTRRAQAISKVCAAAAALVRDGAIVDVRLAYGSVAPVPLRCVRTESVLRGQVVDQALVARARQALDAEITPIDDIRSTAAYRRHVSGNLLAEFLRACT